MKKKKKFPDFAFGEERSIKFNHANAPAQGPQLEVNHKPSLFRVERLERRRRRRRRRKKVRLLAIF